MKPPKRLRNPPKKGFQQTISTSKRQKTTPKRNGQTTAVPHGENIPIASDMEASHNDTRPTDRPLYDVFSLSALSICGPSTSTVHQRPQQQENSLPIAGQETQGVQQGPQQQANSLPIPGQETQGVATFFITHSQKSWVILLNNIHKSNRVMYDVSK